MPHAAGNRTPESRNPIRDCEAASSSHHDRFSRGGVVHGAVGLDEVHGWVRDGQAAERAVQRRLQPLDRSHDRKRKIGGTVTPSFGNHMLASPLPCSAACEGNLPVSGRSGDCGSKTRSSAGARLGSRLPDISRAAPRRQTFAVCLAIHYLFLIHVELHGCVAGALWYFERTTIDSFRRSHSADRRWSSDSIPAGNGSALRRHNHYECPLSPRSSLAVRVSHDAGAPDRSCRGYSDRTWHISLPLLEELHHASFRGWISHD